MEITLAIKRPNSFDRSPPHFELCDFFQREVLKHIEQKVTEYVRGQNTQTFKHKNISTNM